ncbi:hypothetical protein [Lactiplantibacillus carotarum]|uniref:hypothetical protein n=1 Tax=Lactiplantibacillus carotarum TaxID=2993456 RepID=UPI00298ED38C|nr:hypothetical protein [Lactiplantibacillus carotarum]
MKINKNSIGGLLIVLALAFIGIRIYQVQQANKNKDDHEEAIIKVSKARQAQTKKSKRTIVVFSRGRVRIILTLS